jgi:hypothetical protein
MATPSSLESLKLEADVIVLVALGALSALERLARWHVPSGADVGGPALAPNDPALLAALGLVSFARTASRWLDVASELPQPTEPGGDTSPAPSDLLR